MPLKKKKFRQVVTVQGVVANVIEDEKEYLVVAAANCYMCKGTGQTGGNIRPCVCTFSMLRPEGYDLQGMIEECKSAE